MSNHTFDLRLRCEYSASKNAIKDLSVELLVQENWERFELDLETPGFLIFVYSIFTCQHLYLRTNCQEKGIALKSTSGALTTCTQENWKIDRLKIHFDVSAIGDKPGVGEQEYIVDRMKQCPASINLAPIPDFQTSIKFN